MSMALQPKPGMEAGSSPGDRRLADTEMEPQHMYGSTIYTDQPENAYYQGCGWTKGITWLSSKVNQIRLPLTGRVTLVPKMSHLGPPDQCGTADKTDASSQEYENSSTASNMEVSGTESPTSDVPVINQHAKIYTPRMARLESEPMAHPGQNNEVPEARGIGVSTQPQRQVSCSVPAMCNE